MLLCVCVCMCVSHQGCLSACSQVKRLAGSFSISLLMKSLAGRKTNQTYKHHIVFYYVKTRSQNILRHWRSLTFRSGKDVFRCQMLHRVMHCLVSTENVGCVYHLVFTVSAKLTSVNSILLAMCRSDFYLLWGNLTLLKTQSFSWQPINAILSTTTIDWWLKKRWFY